MRPHSAETDNMRSEVLLGRFLGRRLGSGAHVVELVQVGLGDTVSDALRRQRVDGKVDALAADRRCLASGARKGGMQSVA